MTDTDDCDGWRCQGDAEKLVGDDGADVVEVEQRMIGECNRNTQDSSKHNGVVAERRMSLVGVDMVDGLSVHDVAHPYQRRGPEGCPRTLRMQDWKREMVDLQEIGQPMHTHSVAVRMCHHHHFVSPLF